MQHFKLVTPLQVQAIALRYSTLQDQAIALNRQQRIFSENRESDLLVH
ncbi:hypothetical protein [Nodularia spumigena]|nr:hypothetical protein [Nodularia spumigena]MDB9317002.1 hypothetical protein [Nodularia spumigena CS-590/01A]MDB9325426.1 hypothetical protein [Nodularia spumigena CS-590/02]MDB9335064.1 hypothetical protein [Nodularia spumigena CS-590/01]